MTRSLCQIHGNRQCSITIVCISVYDNYVMYMHVYVVNTCASQAFPVYTLYVHILIVQN